MSAVVSISHSVRVAAALAGILAVPTGHAADDPETSIPLDALVVSATRTPQDAASLPNSVELIRLPALADMQMSDTRTALASVAGVIVSNNGAVGAQSSLFIRGASSHQVSLMVDGVRMNDRSASYANFLGGADLVGLDRLEVLRGPQSTLYGSSAMGGVVFLETARGHRDNAGGVLAAHGGSFDSFGATLAGRGGHGPIGFSASLSSFQTSNDRDGNDFEKLSASARLEGDTSDHLLLGGTVRWQQSDYEEPGSRVFPYPGAIDFENLLVTTYGEWRDGEHLRSRLTAALHQRDYVYDDGFAPTVTDHRRTIVDWQNSWAASAVLEVVGGLTYEDTRLLINGGRTNDDVFAGYLNGTWRPRADIVLNAGVRHDAFESAGGATTGRAGVAWLLSDERTKLRATFGTGFTAPGADDRYGVPVWGQLGNPEIEPEKCEGWDVGVDHDFAADGALTASVTYFQNRFRNLFEWETVNFATFEGMIVNRARAETKGAEVAMTWRPTRTITTSLAYTRLDATNLDDDLRLIRRPRHTLHLDAHWHATPAWLLGVGAHMVGGRFDSTDLGNAAIEDYTTVRLYASYAVRPEWIIKLRLENALDERYDEVFGYAALPRAVHGSVEWRF